MIKVGISNGTNREATIHTPDKRDPTGGGPPGLVVYTREGLRPRVDSLFFFNPTIGIDLNQSVTFTGDQELIHNGLDDVQWTASALSGPSTRWDFNSSTQASTGSFSINAIATRDGDEALFTSPTILSGAGWSAFTADAFISAFDIIDNDIEIRFRLSGSDVGNSVSLASYVNRLTFNIWQPFIIDQSIFGITGESINEMVIKTVSPGGTPPDYFLDAMRLLSGGNPITFILAPRPGTIFMGNTLDLQFEGPFDSRLTNSSMPSVPTSGFLNVPRLANGIVFSIVQRGRRQGVDAVFKGMNDMLTFPQITAPVIVGDASSTTVLLRIQNTAINYLDSRSGDRLELTINDDLSALTRFRFSAGGGSVAVVDAKNNWSDNPFLEV